MHTNRTVFLCSFALAAAALAAHGCAVKAVAPGELAPTAEPAPSPTVAPTQATDPAPGAPRWELVEAPTREDLYGVWSLADDDAWAVGDRGTALHWDGARWSSANAASYYRLARVWASGPRDVWALGRDVRAARPALLRWNAEARAWAPVENDWHGTLAGLWGSGPEDLWLVGSQPEGANLWHWDGERWSDEHSGTIRPGMCAGPSECNAGLTAVGGTSRDNVWVSWGYGSFARWDGARWDERSHGAGSFVPDALWVYDRDEAWLGGDVDGELHCTRASCSFADANDRPSVALDDGGFETGELLLNDLWGAGRDDVWSVGSFTRAEGAGDRTVYSAISHWDGSVRSADANPGRAPLYGVHGNGPASVWAVGARGTVLRRAR